MSALLRARSGRTERALRGSARPVLERALRGSARPEE
jgi:hypothetical protein